MPRETAQLPSTQKPPGHSASVVQVGWMQTSLEQVKNEGQLAQVRGSQWPSDEHASVGVQSLSCRHGGTQWSVSYPWQTPARRWLQTVPTVHCVSSVQVGASWQTQPPVPYGPAHVVSGWLAQSAFVRQPPSGVSSPESGGELPASTSTSSRPPQAVVSSAAQKTKRKLRIGGGA